MTAVTIAQDIRGFYTTRFEQRQAKAGEPAWLVARRAAGFRRFLAEGFPTTRDEEFLFTNVAPIAERAFGDAAPFPVTGGATPGVAALKASAVVPGLDAHELVFVNGRFAPTISTIGDLPPGVRLTNLATLLADDPQLLEPHWGRAIKFDMQGFTALNTALAADGGVLLVPADVVVERPVHFLYLSQAPEAFAAHLRTIVVVGRHAQVHVVESYAGAAGQEYFTNALTEVIGGDGSRIEHCRVQRESLAAYHVSIYRGPRSSRPRTSRSAAPSSATTSTRCSMRRASPAR
jgi:Fe-S cluster assembly protein SufD